MLATNHALTGAVLGALLPLPLAIPAAFASHFILDTLPHYGIKPKLRNKSKTYKLIVVADITIALIGSLGLALLNKWQMNLCAWIAWSPDLFWVVYVLNHKDLQIIPKNWFTRLHLKIQWAEWPWAIAVEAVLFAALLPIYISKILN